jgi:hypothetical protein
MLFFEGIPLLDVIFYVKPDGRGSGEAVVLLASVLDQERALSMDRQHMGRRYIEVFPVLRTEYYTAAMNKLMYGMPR